MQPIGNRIPSKFSLYQNYPNPFNPSTVIHFDLTSLPLSFGEGLGVRLIIIDVLGKEIAVLVNEKLSPGSYEINWDALNVPAGIYFYRLQTEGFTETKKLILLK